MFHGLKDKFESLKMEKTIEATAQKSGDGSDQMMSLQCFQGHDQARSVRYGAGNVPQLERAVCQLYDEHLSQVGAHLDHSSKEGCSLKKKKTSPAPRTN